jgi:oligoribonuclease
MLVWVDLETTGLAADECAVLEVACIATDDAYAQLGRFERVVYWEGAAIILDGFAAGLTPDQIAASLPGHLKVDPYVIEMHRKNGLWERVPHGEAPDTVDRDLAAFILAHCPGIVSDRGGARNGPQLAGSTISFDRAFLGRHLPRASANLHYRNLDVSSFNEAARRRWPSIWEKRPRKASEAVHRGMADIEESLDVMRHYDRVFGRALDYAWRYLDASDVDDPFKILCTGE